MQNFNPQQFLSQMGYTNELKGNINLDALKIRPARIEDSFFMNELRIMDGVFENCPSVYSERISFSQNMINGLSGESDHMFVAEAFMENRVVILGIAGLHVNKNPRMKHSATIGILVHTAYQGKGIGKKLMDKVIDLADNWLLLKRIELEVISDNIPAINLYKKYGFTQEGIKKYCVIKNGKYMDAVLMARYK
ncbi:MAG TPA: GNAT family N-acetyltransferase [Candidatus Gastranaerophilales bacterium]|nr:GNAT family N-acetyltransferase [Candidatus Gastranaerophilales bacterium]